MDESFTENKVINTVNSGPGWQLATNIHPYIWTVAQRKAPEHNCKKYEHLEKGIVKCPTKEKLKGSILVHAWRPREPRIGQHTLRTLSQYCSKPKTRENDNLSRAKETHRNKSVTNTTIALPNASRTKKKLQERQDLSACKATPGLQDRPTRTENLIAILHE